jgi:hypothetical protein
MDVRGKTQIKSFCCHKNVVFATMFHRYIDEDYRFKNKKKLHTSMKSTGIPKNTVGGTSTDLGKAMVGHK